jgi:hypothetical protein
MGAVATGVALQCSSGQASPGGVLDWRYDVT